MKRIGLFILSLLLVCCVFGQDTLSVAAIDTTTANVALIDITATEADAIDTVAADIAATDAVLSQVTANALLKSWQRNYPFVASSDSAILAARADTLLNKEVHPFSYSNEKLAADSIKAVIRCIPFNDTLYIGQPDLRMPIINSGKVPEKDTYSLAEEVNNLNNRSWSYMEPADASLLQQDKVQEQRQLAVYNYAQHDPSKFDYSRGNMVLPPTMDRSKFVNEGLESHRIAPVESAKAVGQMQGVRTDFDADVWHRKGTSDLQLSQTALSDNWYKGGDNNMTVSTVQKLEFSRYDESKITTFDVIMELRLSAYYTKADTVNQLRVNDNLFSLTVKYGYKAWKNWYYSTNLYAKTPIFDYHNSNSHVTKSTFLSPLEANLSVGMEYKYTSPNKKVTYNLLLAPLAYNMKYVGDHRVDETSYGLKEGKNILNQIGTTVSTSLSWKIKDDIYWSSRLYYFTSYKNIQTEFENTFNFNVSRRFTAKIYLYPRFDDSHDNKLQMKEMLTFGFSYIW